MSELQRCGSILSAISSVESCGKRLDRCNHSQGSGRTNFANFFHHNFDSMGARVPFSQRLFGSLSPPFSRALETASPYQDDLRGRERKERDDRTV